MFDREIAKDSLLKISKTIDTIIERLSTVNDPNDFLCSPGGMMCLDAICMNLNFEIDTDIVFRTLQEDVPQLRVAIDKIIADF